MTKNLLDYFFKPESVAVVGASSREGQVGRILLDNLKEGGFPGEIFPVNPGGRRDPGPDGLCQPQPRWGGRWTWR